MSDWTEGYVTGIGYIHGYYRELSPVLQRFALLLAGYAPPPEDGAYLEMGYGQGVAAVVNAATTPNPYWGTDFNPDHAANAQSLARAAGLESVLLDQSFAELHARRDLPGFDYISLHGIWTWVSEENQRTICDILRNSLNVGGVAYVSYNSMPGWAVSVPLSRLLALHRDCVGSECQGIREQVESALAFAQSLVDAKAGYFQLHPQAVERLQSLAPMDRAYVAHEYFNGNWVPQAFSDVAAVLWGAKLEFAASAHLLDHVDAVNLTSEAQAVLRGIHHPVFHQTVRDVFTNQQFRRDLFQRGRRRLSAPERMEALLATPVALLERAEEVPMTIKGAIGDVTLNRDIYEPLVAALARDGYRPRTIGSVARELPRLSLPQLIEAVTLLVGAGQAHPAQAPAVAEAVQGRAAALNTELRRRAQSDDMPGILASPVIGSAVAVQRVHQLCLSARAAGKATPAEWARHAWEVLDVQGQRMMKDGKMLVQPEDNMAELTREAQDFADRSLAVLTALGVAG